MRIAFIQPYKQNFLGNIGESASKQARATLVNQQNAPSANQTRPLEHLSYYQIEQRCSTTNFQIKKLKDIPCASCGNIMVTNQELEDFVKKTKNAKGEELIDALKSNYARYRPIEKLVVNGLLETIPAKSNKPLLELIKILNKEHISELEQAQGLILDKMSLLNKGFKEKESRRINNLITRSKQDIVYSRTHNEAFKRKAFIEDVRRLGETISDQEKYEKIIQAAQSLPSSTNSLSAFYAKYSRRSPQEIAFRLLAPSLITAEHIKPQHANGENKISNYLAECAHCNSRRGCMSFAEWLKIQPDMPENALKYFQEIERRVKKGELAKTYVNYSTRAIKTLRSESQGLIAVAMPPVL